jgi:hypothetical protein
MKRLIENILDGEKDVNGSRNKKKERLVIIRKEIKIYKPN